jgi:hypothetical protein
MHPGWLVAAWNSVAARRPAGASDRRDLGTCEGLIAFSVEEGEVSGVDVAGTKAIEPP